MITKHIIIVFSISIMMNFDNKSFGQYNYVKLPTLDSLLFVLNITDSLNLINDLSEYKNTYRLHWSALVPNVGYDLVYKRPIVIWSSSGLVSHFENKRSVERKEISLNNKSESQHRANSIRLINLYNNLQIQLTHLTNSKESFLLHQQLYEIKLNQHKSNEINTEQFLSEQIKFNAKELEFYTTIENINELFLSIELLLNTKLFESLTYNQTINGN